MSATVSLVGLVLTALLMWMIACHLTVSLNVTMVAPVLIEWGHFFAVALQIILVNYLCHFDIECIINIMLYPEINHEAMAANSIINRYYYCTGCHALDIRSYYI